MNVLYSEWDLGGEYRNELDYCRCADGDRVRRFDFSDVDGDALAILSKR
jgi:hypothetical protein